MRLHCQTEAPPLRQSLLDIFSGVAIGCWIGHRFARIGTDDYENRLSLKHLSRQGLSFVLRTCEGLDTTTSKSSIKVRDINIDLSSVVPIIGSECRFRGAR